MKITRIAAVILGAAAVAVFAAPHVPGSPVACLAVPAGCRGATQLDWVFALAFVIPAALACLGGGRR